jgi:hypothetical protein
MDKIKPVDIKEISPGIEDYWTKKVVRIHKFLNSQKDSCIYTCTIEDLQRIPCWMLSVVDELSKKIKKG